MSLELFFKILRVIIFILLLIKAFTAIAEKAEKTDKQTKFKKKEKKKLDKALKEKMKPNKKIEEKIKKKKDIHNDNIYELLYVIFSLNDSVIQLYDLRNTTYDLFFSKQAIFTIYDKIGKNITPPNFPDMVINGCFEEELKKIFRTKGEMIIRELVRNDSKGPDQDYNFYEIKLQNNTWTTYDEKTLSNMYIKNNDELHFKTFKKDDLLIG